MAFLRALLVLALAAAAQAAPVRIGTPQWRAMPTHNVGYELSRLSTAGSPAEQKAALWALHSLVSENAATRTGAALGFHAKLYDEVGIALLRAEDPEELGRAPRAGSEARRLRDVALTPRKYAADRIDALARKTLGATRRKEPGRFQALRQLESWLDLDQRPGSAAQSAVRAAGPRLAAAIPDADSREQRWLFLGAFSSWKRGGRDRELAMSLQESIPSLRQYMTRADARRMINGAALEDEELRRRVVASLARELGMADTAPETLLARAPDAARAGMRETEALTQLWALTLMREPEARQELWRRIATGSSPGSLRALPSKSLWSRKNELERKLPTLAAALEDPRRLSDLLTRLSLLRMLVPYHLANDSELAPIEWGNANGLVFPLDELRIYPVSESFRRFIVTDASGGYAVELKMPGDHRAYLESTHFTLARTLSRARPRPLSVEPLHFSAYSGTVKLYGRGKSFPVHDPMGIVLFAYEDGKRRSNSLRFLGRIARRQGRSFEDAAKRVDADSLEAAAYLHRRGWIGHNEAGNDSHAENVRVLKNGRSVLVADFQAYERVFADAQTRRADAAVLIARGAAERDSYKGSYLDKVELEGAQRRRVLELARRRLRARETDPERLRRGLRALELSWPAAPDDE